MSRAGLLGRKTLPHPRRSQYSPSTARQEPPVPLHLRTRGRGRDNHWLFHGQHRSRGPRHASGRLSLRFGPGDWAGSDPLAGEGEPGARVGVTHPRGVGPPASRPRLPEVPEAAGTGRGLGTPGSAERAFSPEAGACPRFRMRHQQTPVGVLTIGQLGARHVGIPRAGFHSNRLKFTQAFNRLGRPLCVCCSAAREPRSAATTHGLKGENPRPAPPPRPVQESNGASFRCEHSFIYTL